jgi:hypothetical protein
MNEKAELYSRYPVWSVVLYNGSTVLHFFLGAAGIVFGYGLSPVAAGACWIFYLAFAFAELYLLMPLIVCPSCVYYRLDNSLCVSGLNMFSKRIAKPRDPSEFPKRAEGILCCNNLYMAALLLPILALIPALLVNFSVGLLSVLLLLIALFLFRLFVIFPKVGCVHCRAKFECPQAGAMGVRSL